MLERDALDKMESVLFSFAKLAPSGPMLSEKRHIRENNEFDVFRLPANHGEFLLLLITDLPPSSVSHLIDHGVSMMFMLQRE